MWWWACTVVPKAVWIGIGWWPYIVNVIQCGWQYTSDFVSYYE